MASAIVVGNGSHYFSNARQDIQRDTQFVAKELEELKTPSGVRVQLCPTFYSTALTT